MSGFQEHNPLDAQGATPYTPSTFDCAPPPPPLPELPLWGHYTDTSLQVRAGVMPGMPTALAVVAMDNVLRREHQQAEDQGRADEAQAQPSPSGSAPVPHPTRLRSQAPAPSAAPVPTPMPDLCCQSTAQALGWLQDKLQALRDARRDRARTPARVAGALWLAAWLWPVLMPRLAAMVRVLFPYQEALLLVGWCLWALALGVGVFALRQRWRASPAEQATRQLLRCWQAVLPEAGMVLTPALADRLCTQAGLSGLSVQIRFFEWQVPARRLQAPVEGQAPFVLTFEHGDLGYPPAAEQARLLSCHPKESVARRMERLLG
ncbi:hypothetical protein PSQ39_15460 [Curvibacter sp. HBC28]|uniref:Uncharacterized protein n=1 Tax=Curvibacter microcysteis TaxID=3026419 RepID=A0ABT5MJ59_9BURK|nr:hypothetical protein [Curvibacter sp. HBC28]MDD0816034.1 hypothetical protein [Curvibacter sp. HBC28]